MWTKLLLAGACVLSATQARVVRPRGEPPASATLTSNPLLPTSYPVLRPPPPPAPPAVEPYDITDEELDELYPLPRPEPCTKSPTYADGCPGPDGTITIPKERTWWPQPPGRGHGRRTVTPSSTPSLQLARDSRATLTSHAPRETAPIIGIPYPPSAAPYIGHIPHGWTEYPGRGGKKRPSGDWTELSPKESQHKEENTDNHETQVTPEETQVPTQSSDDDYRGKSTSSAPSSPDETQESTQSSEDDYRGKSTSSAQPSPSKSRSSSSETQPSSAKSQAAQTKGQSSPSESQKSTSFDACEALPKGAGPVPDPDTADSFLDYQGFTKLSNDAQVPEGYKLVEHGSNLQAAVSGRGFLAAISLRQYDPSECSEFCSRRPECAAFNTYFERDPRYAPNDMVADCNNPPSSTNIVCALWGDELTADRATNNGGYRAGFQVVVAGSNIYNRDQTSTDASDGDSPDQSEEPTATTSDDDTPTNTEQPDESSSSDKTDSSSSRYPADSPADGARHGPIPYRPTNRPIAHFTH